MRASNKWVLAALCLVLATVLISAPGAFAVDLAVRVIDRSPDVRNLDTTDTLKWYADESIDYTVRPRRGRDAVHIPADATATWSIADAATGTNYLSAVAIAQTSNSVTFHIPLGGVALPEGVEWVSFVTLLQGTNFLGVIDRTRVECLWSPYTSAAVLIPTNPLPELLRQFATTGYIAAAIAPLQDSIATNSAAIEAIDGRVDGLWAECAGGWHLPDYFLVDWIATASSDGAFTNAFSSTVDDCNVSLGIGVQSVYKGWRIDSTIYRTGTFDGAIEWSDGAGEDSGLLPLTYTNGLVMWPEDTDFAALDGLDDGEMAAAVDREIVGRLGGYVCRTNIAWAAGGAQRSSSTWRIFTGPATDTLLADLWNAVLGVASNRAASPWGKSLRRWPNGYGTPDGVAWNTNFFAYGTADFSCVSFWVEGSYPAGVYKPVTMVTPRHGIVANHWKPNKGTNVLWLGRSGEILTNRVVAYRNLGGDLTVARLERAFSTNEVLPALLLNQQYRNYLCGSTNAPGYYRQGNAGTWGVPVIPFDCAERGGVAWWKPRCLIYGDMDQEEAGDYYGITEDKSLPQWKATAVGGDSGSPTFALVPGAGAPVLLGCYHYAWGGPIPMVESVNDGIALWGDEERASSIDFSNLGYQNYNTNGLPPAP